MKERATTGHLGHWSRDWAGNRALARCGDLVRVASERWHLREKSGLDLVLAHQNLEFFLILGVILTF